MRAWPGLFDTQSLVNPVEAGRFADVRGRLTAAGVELEAKTEFHVTVLNGACTSDVLHAMRERNMDEVRVAARFAACEWTWRDRGERWLLRHADPGKPLAHSVITLIDMPALNAFRRWLETEFGMALPWVPPHVMLYTAGDPQGIGLASEEQFVERRVMRLQTDPGAGNA